MSPTPYPFTPQKPERPLTKSVLSPTIEDSHLVNHTVPYKEWISGHLVRLGEM